MLVHAVLHIVVVGQPWDHFNLPTSVVVAGVGEELALLTIPVVAACLERTEETELRSNRLR